MEPLVIILVPGIVGGLLVALLMASTRRGARPPWCHGVSPHLPRHSSTWPTFRSRAWVASGWSLL